MKHEAFWFIKGKRLLAFFVNHFIAISYLCNVKTWNFVMSILGVIFETRYWETYIVQKEMLWAFMKSSN